ncbi:MAG: hypothetical protein AAF721_11765, partial [Myxococcota bacterium]
VEPLAAALPPGTPPFAGPAVNALTGEILVANAHDASGLAMLLGVADQAPIAGLITLASTQLDKIPKVLPDGSAVSVALESVEIGGTKTQALHARVTPSATSAASYEAMNLEPEGWLFGAGPYAGVVFGTDKAGLDRLVSATPKGPSAAFAATLPPSLAAALESGTVAGAAHMPFDGVGVLLGKDMNEEALAQLPAGVLGAGVNLKEILRNVGTTLAPLSAFSQWMQIHDGQAVGHVVITVFGDGRTEEGKAALGVLDELLAGGEAASTYAAFADAHGGSARAHGYEVRAGRATDGALVSTALLGVFAAIAVPAFTKYIERSKAARP